MSKYDKVFFGGALVAAALVASFLLLQIMIKPAAIGGGGVSAGAAAGSAFSQSVAVEHKKTLADVLDENPCRCYAYAYEQAARAKFDIMSSAYQAGFEQCRSFHGAAGGDAWTAGWLARSQAKPFDAQCRGYRSVR